jgi:hypothetical protein
MAGRKRRLPEDARPVTISLGGEERLVLQVIEVSRQRRSEGRDSPSEIVSDALWHFLTTVERIPREKIEALLPAKTPEHKTSNIKSFPTPS